MEEELHLSLKIASFGLFLGVYFFLLYIKERFSGGRWWTLTVVAVTPEEKAGRKGITPPFRGPRVGRTSPNEEKARGKDGAFPQFPSFFSGPRRRPSLTWDRLLLVGIGLFVLYFWPTVTQAILLIVLIWWGFRRAWVARRQRGQIRQLEKELAEASLFLLNVLRGGGNLTQALSALTQQHHNHLTLEIAACLREYEVGTPLIAALLKMTERFPSPHLRFFVDALDSFARGGGNPEGLLTALAATLQEREELRGELEAKIAEATFSGIFLAVLPGILALVFYQLQSQWWLNLTREPLGQVGLVYGALSWITGLFFLRSLVRINLDD